MALSLPLKRVAVSTIRLSRFLVEQKQKAEAVSSRRKAEDRSRFDKTVEAAEARLVEVLQPFIRRQISTTIKRFKAGDAEPFKPRSWDRELIDRTLPILAQTFGESMLAELKALGVDVDSLRRKCSQMYTTKDATGSVKASTATEWLEESGEDWLDITTFRTAYGDVSMGFMTEYPDWMKASIRDNMKESFSQDYWKKVNDTTYGDINRILEWGAEDGMSVEAIAEKLSANLFEEGKYALRRGRTIARTELGNALNGARSSSMDALIESVGPELPMKKQWLSVLGTTTRDTHAHLDGVPADKENRWTLDGVRCRWPGDVFLPARSRINCQCTIHMAFGLDDASAQELISSHTDRIATKKTVGTVFTKAFCPTGPGGGINNSCGYGSGGSGKGPLTSLAVDGSGNCMPGSVGSFSGIDTSKWKLGSIDTNWGMKKLAKLEAFAAKGDWASFEKNMSNPKSDWKTLNTQQKALLVAQKNMLVMKGEQIDAVPTGAKPSTAVPGAVTGEWKKLSGKLGTEEGGIYEMGGKKYYVKTPEDEGRVHNEVLACKLYELGGGNVVKAQLVEINGKKAYAAEWVDSEKMDWKSGAEKAKAAEDFALHAWLNNRDAVGAGMENPMDNIRSVGGKPVLVDAGGALDYKGMGGSGKKDLYYEAKEWNTLRDPGQNPTMAKVFGDMTAQQLVDSAAKLKNIKPDDISDLVNKYHGGSDAERLTVLGKLLTRRLNIIKEADNLAAAIKIVTKNNPPKPAETPKPPEPAKPSESAAKPSVPMPAPPIFTAKSVAYLNKSVVGLTQAALKGDLNAVKAFPVSETTTDAYYKKLAAYKKALVAHLEGGGTVTATTTQTSTPGAKPPTPAPSITDTYKLSSSKMPATPNFVTSNQALKAVNQGQIAAIVKAAEDGDFNAVVNWNASSKIGDQSIGSPKVSMFLKQTITAMKQASKEASTPPALPVRVSSKMSVKELSASLPAKPPDNAYQVGHWNVLADLGAVPADAPKGTWVGKGGSAPIQAKGNEIVGGMGVKAIATSYTGMAYGSINASLRKGLDSSESYKKGVKLGEALVKKGQEIPEGLLLSRKHAGDLEGIKPGMVLADKAVMSTSLSQDVWHGKVIWQLTVGPGVKGLGVYHFSKNDSENEVILPPNQRILVTKVEQKGEYWHGHAVLLPTVKNQCCPP